MSKAKKVLIAIGSLALLLLLLVSLPIIYIELIVPRYTEVPPEVVINPSVLKEADRQFLMSRGLSDPVNDIVKDLSKHPELIPCKGTLGGTPGFENPGKIIVQGRNRVAATFSDGHYDGEIELTFTASEGRIVWKAVRWDCHGYD